MNSALQLKRKNIAVPTDTLKKLSVMAIAQGKSLKKYIETILIAKADSIAIEISEHPSPSRDEWFENPKNISEIKDALKEAETSGTKTYTLDELHSILGV